MSSLIAEFDITKPSRWLSTCYYRSFLRRFYSKQWKTAGEHPNWHIYFDGAVNMYGNSVVGAILISWADAHFPEAIKLRTFLYK